MTDDRHSKGLQPAIEASIGMSMRRLASTAITVEEMLQKRYSPEEHRSTKEEVYKQIVRYLRIEGHYWVASTEANISDLVYAIISPIIDDFICKTGRDTVYLYRERQPIFVDCNPEGYKEFVVVDNICVSKTRKIMIIEAPMASFCGAMAQCLVALKNMHDSIRGIVYGFVTTGDSWRMLSYDGERLKVTDKIEVIFDTMVRNKEKWMKEFSVLVDCIYAALDS